MPRATTDIIDGAGTVIERHPQPHPNDRLRDPFPPDKVGKLPRYIGPRNVAKTDRERATCEVCGKYHEQPSIHLDYVGHAEVTARLLDVDPEWSWEPFATDPDGLPLVAIRGDEAELWIRLTINGITRPGVGSAAADHSDLAKNLVSDALRNAAMRFGVALELWSKAGDDEERDAGPAAPQVVDRPCPGCGRQVQDNRTAHKADSKKPAWRCTNRACTAGSNGRSWASWDERLVLDTWPEARMHPRMVNQLKADLLEGAAGDKDKATEAWRLLLERYSLSPDELPPLALADELSLEARLWFTPPPAFEPEPPEAPVTLTNATTGESVTAPAGTHEGMLLDQLKAAVAAGSRKRTAPVDEQLDAAHTAAPGELEALDAEARMIEEAAEATAGDAQADEPDPLAYAEDDPERPF